MELGRARDCKAIKLTRGRKVRGKFENSPGIIAAEVPLAIGVSFDDKDEFMSFDELCMWNRVLTDKEIKTLYNNGHGIALPKD